MKKKGMELSIDFLVMLILSITMFGLSIVLLTKIFITTNEISEKAQDEMDKLAEALACKTSDQICIGENRKEIEREDYDIFSLKILNINEYNTYFYVNMSQSETCSDRSNIKILTLYINENNKWIMLDPNKSKAIGLGVEVSPDASSGICTFDIGVYQCKPQLLTHLCNRLDQFTESYKDEVYKVSVKVS